MTLTLPKEKAILDITNGIECGHVTKTRPTITQTATNQACSRPECITYQPEGKLNSISARTDAKRNNQEKQKPKQKSLFIDGIHLMTQNTFILVNQSDKTLKYIQI